MSNGDSKILKTGPEEGEAEVQRECESNEVESNGITDADNSATEEGDGNESDVSGREAEEKGTPSSSMRLAIVLAGFPRKEMTEEQADVVATALVGRIRGELVQFSATRYESGGLVLTCANKATKVWLHKIVPKVVPWPGARLAVGQADTTLKGARFVLWLVMGMHKRSNDQILDFFQKQNKDISTAEWKIVRRVTESDAKQRIELWVDDKSVEDLKAHNYQLFLGLARPKFVQWSEWKEQIAGKVSANRRDWWPAVQNSSRPPAFRSVSRFRGRGFSGRNLRPQISRFGRQNGPPHQEFEFADTDTLHFRGARERAYTGPAVLQNGESRFSPSGRHRESGFGTSRRLQLRRDGYVVSGGRIRGGTVYSSEHYRENSLFPRNRNEFEKPVFRDSYRPSSRDTRFGDVDEPPFQGSRFRGSGRMQPRGSSFVERDTSYPRESGSRMSDPQHFRDYGSTVSRTSRSSGVGFSSQPSRSYYSNSSRFRSSRPSGRGRAKW